MRIAIASPLYPPDIAMPAPYVKELASRLAAAHDVTIVTYGHLPEPIAGVRILSVSKQRPLPIRLMAYTLALLRIALRSDRIYALNGASVELPVSLVSFLTRKPLFVHLGDAPAHERAQVSRALRFIEKLFVARAAAVISDKPLARPEILPFSPFPAEEQDAYETAWAGHVRILENAFSYA